MDKKNKKRPRRNEILEALEWVRPILEKKFHVKKLALFGSCARDEAKKNSDVDIVIHFSEKPNFTLLGKLIVFLETHLDGCRVDLVDFEKMLPAIRKSAEKDFIYVDEI